MSLPIHRWFRYSAGFAAQWVEQVLSDWKIKQEHLVLDPFAGSGTVSVVCDMMGIPSLGIEAHPFVARILEAKLLWNTPPERVSEFADAVVTKAYKQKPSKVEYPKLIKRSYEPRNLAALDSLKSVWVLLQNKSPESELVWLALTAILRSTSTAGTAQWQYIDLVK
jgi:hypothetical protein